MMAARKGIVWLASYPKSGNTWFRILLSRLLNSSSSLDYINDIDTILGSTMLVNRAAMNKVLGFDSFLLTQDELENLRSQAYQWQAQQQTTVSYNKIHDAYTYLLDTSPLIPAQGCLGAIYFIRNPLDVAISMAHHVKCPVDWSIAMMGNKEFAMPLKNDGKSQLRQKLSTWSLHARSWISAQAIPILVLRYEDMVFKPLATFSKAMQFLALNPSQQQLQQAIDDTAFTKLQRHEQQVGFKEKPPMAEIFFRKGIVGDWQKTLTKQQIQKIIQDHGEMMFEFGYLDEKNQPIA